MDKDPLKNSRKKFSEKIQSMSDDEKKKAGQMARQHLAESDEQLYQFKRNFARCIIILIVACVLGLFIIGFLREIGIL